VKDCIKAKKIVCVFLCTGKERSECVCLERPRVVSACVVLRCPMWAACRVALRFREGLGAPEGFMEEVDLGVMQALPEMLL